MSKILVVTRGDFVTRVALDRLLRSPRHDCAVVTVSGDDRGRQGLSSLRALWKASETHYFRYELNQFLFFNLAKLWCREPRLEVAGLAEEINDPLEGLNRGIFWFNDLLDTWIFRPIAWTYGWLMPDFLKSGVRNGFDNFNSPIILANDLLQFEFEDAAVTTGRLVINSTIGIAGLFDVASEMGLEAHHADFGQTLHSYGVGQGFYFVVPLLGPTTARDGVGMVGDIFLHPRTYLLDFKTNLYLTAGNVLVKREELIEPLDDLKETSLDFYAAVRSAYYQNRGVELNRGRPLPATKADDIFDETFDETFDE